MILSVFLLVRADMAGVMGLDGLESYLNNTNITTVTGQAEPESTRPAGS